MKRLIVCFAVIVALMSSALAQVSGGIAVHYDLKGGPLQCAVAHIGYLEDVHLGKLRLGAFDVQGVFAPGANLSLGVAFMKSVPVAKNAYLSIGPSVRMFGDSSVKLKVGGCLSLTWQLSP